MRTRNYTILMSDGEYNLPTASQYPEEIYHLLKERTLMLLDIDFQWEYHHERALGVYDYIRNHQYRFDRKKAKTVEEFKARRRFLKSLAK